MAVDRIDLGVHQKRIADTREYADTRQTCQRADVIKYKWSKTHVVRMPHGGWWG